MENISPKLEIDMVDIYNILGNALRPLEEGEAVLLAGHILLCGFETKAENSIKIVAFVVQTSKINDLPYQVDVTISVENNEKTISVYCECPAGQGDKCKHIFATLMKINRDRTSNLEYISCTDVKQKWGKYKKNLKLPYDEVIPIESYCHFQRVDAKVVEVKKPLKDFFFETLIAEMQNGEAAIHVSKTRNTKETLPVTANINERNMLQSSFICSLLNNTTHLDWIKDTSDTHFTDFYLRTVKISFSNAVQLYMNTINQTNKLWKNARRCRITGSVCYELFTYCFNKTPDWVKKVEKVFFPTFRGTSDTLHGLRNEGKALDLYAELFEVTVHRCGLIVHSAVPCLGYSADGIVRTENILLEVKCPKEGKTNSADIVLSNAQFTHQQNDTIALKKQHKYYAQVQLGMLLLNCPKCHFIVYSSFDHSIAVIEIGYDQEFVEKMLKSLKDAYFKYLLPVLENKLF